MQMSEDEAYKRLEKFRTENAAFDAFVSHVEKNIQFFLESLSSPQKMDILVAKTYLSEEQKKY